MLLIGNTFEEVKVDTLCLFYLDPRLIYIKGLHLVKDLISFIEQEAPITLEEHRQSVQRINTKISKLKDYKQSFISFLMHDPNIEKRLDDLYDSSFLLNRDDFLLTGSFRTNAIEDKPSKIETPLGPFTRSQLSSSYIGNLYVGINQSSQVVRASDIVDLIGGTVEKEVIAEEIGISSVSAKSNSLVLGEFNYEYPLVLSIRPKVDDAREYPLPVGPESITTYGVLETSIVTLYRERVVCTPAKRVEGPLFLKKSDSFSLEVGNVFKGDIVIDRDTLTATTVLSGLGSKIRTSAPITMSTVECLCSMFGLWEVLVSSLNKITISSKDYAQEYEAQAQKLRSTLSSISLLNYQEQNLGEKLLKIKEAHERVGASRALFYLDSCKINEYNSLTSESILNVESNSINEIRKFGI